jgi:hypothetical protein
METTRPIGFEGTDAEVCLLKRKDNDGTVMICLFVDDCLLTGERTAIDKAIVDRLTFNTLNGKLQISKITSFGFLWSPLRGGYDVLAIDGKLCNTWSTIGIIE